jgi:hypothetical protein
MIRNVIDDSRVVNYDHRSGTIVMPSFGASLLEPSFRLRLGKLEGIVASCRAERKNLKLSVFKETNLPSS